MPAGGASEPSQPLPHRAKAGHKPFWLSPTTRDRLHNTLVDAPMIGNAYVRLRPQLRHAIVTPRTQLILDGFPRSANAYAEWAFRYANEDIRLAVRLHSPRAVQVGVRYGIPTVVLVREPRAAVASWLQYKRGLRPQDAFHRYAHYYDVVADVRDEIVVAEFPDVVDDFGGVIKRCNQQFGTDFALYPGGPTAEAWVRGRIESAWADDETGEPAEHEVPRPSRDRALAAAVLQGMLHDPQILASLQKAERAYERFVAGGR
jgi:hypothetical protein